MINKKFKICVIGLGYVGLPLALEFSKQFKVVGYDINEKRIKSLKKSKDINKETLVNYNKNLLFTCYKQDIKDCNIYIVAVPTPINSSLQPNISLLKNASKLVGSVLNQGDIVIFESTVYPGCTRNECIPIVSKYSNLIPNKDFFFGYSPERINPGDKIRTLTKITKVVSGSTLETLKIIKYIYAKIIKAGLHTAESIEIAEAAKVIENTQRDLNIAFMNELSIIFNKLDISFSDVLKASLTKWNFLDFKPGLVGGHCIGVDPYYLSYIAKKNNYNPNFLISGRKINNYMPKYFNKLINKKCKEKKLIKKNFKILILGLSFKANVTDLRNSKVFDLIKILHNNFKSIDIYDPHISLEQLDPDYKTIFKKIKINEITEYDIIIFAVPHKKLDKYKNKIEKNYSSKKIIVDLTMSMKNEIVDLGF